MLDFEENWNEFREKGIQVIAASVDPIEKARETVERYNISYLIGYGLDVRDVSGKTGAFYDEKDRYLHATGFIMDTDGRIANGVYSTLSIGRLVPRDCIGLIEHLRKNELSDHLLFMKDRALRTLSLCGSFSSDFPLSH